MARTITIAVILSAFACSLASGSSVSAAQVAVVANKSVPADSLSKPQLLDYYTGERRYWGDGKPVVVFDLRAKGDTRDAFYDFIGKSPSRMKSIWMKRMLLGEGEPPESLKTEEEVVERVAATEGAIGFADTSQVTSEVKVLATIEVGDK